MAITIINSTNVNPLTPFITCSFPLKLCAV